MMTDLSEEILKNWMTRKKYAQKSEFIAFLKQYFPEMKEEDPAGLTKSRNLILGDVENASYIFTAHYDTYALLPFPNLVFTNNLIATIGYSVITVLPLFILAVALGTFLMSLGAPPMVGVGLMYLMMFLSLYMIYAGIPSKTTVNDNTSGVITLIELYTSMNEQQKAKTAIVFFDNEELGLLGSAAFSRKYRKLLTGKTIVNFDCVSDGDNICFLLRGDRASLADTIRECYAQADKNLLIRRPFNTFYPSDQSSFRNSIGVCALHHCLLGYYIPRIHTKRDVIMDRRNIEYLVSGSLKLINRD